MPRDALLVHCIVIAAALACVLPFLLNRRLFAPDRTGFWVWIAFLICLVVNPALTLASRDFSVYDYYTRGTDLTSARVFWILFTAAAGILVFFLAYLNTRPAGIVVSHIRLSPIPVLIIVAVSMAIGWNAILRYRIAGNSDLRVVGGKFVGSVSGWQSETHGFIIFPCLLLIALKGYRLMGLLAAAFYIALRLGDKGDRFSILALPLAVLLFYMIRRGRRWPPLLYSALAMVLLLVLVARGHGSLASLQHSGNDIQRIAGRALSNIGRGADTAMLPTLYRESDLVERNGFTYGVTCVQEIFLAPLPRTHFPWKDDVLSFIPGVKYRNESWLGDVYHAKSTVIGSFYGYGGILGVIIGMACLGWLLRKMDGLLQRTQPLLVNLWAVMVLSTVWLGILGSIEWWYKVIMMWSLPLFALVLLAKLSAALAPARLEPQRRIA
jgi:hypothetical protein